MTFYVRLSTAAERVESLRRAAFQVSGDATRRLMARADAIESAAASGAATTFALPLPDRAPALCRWAEKVQRSRGATPLELAAAHEVEALGWEEAGDSDRAERARRNAALALGARLDPAGFHTDPDPIA